MEHQIQFELESGQPGKTGRTFKVNQKGQIGGGHSLGGGGVGKGLQGLTGIDFSRHTTLILSIFLCVIEKDILKMLFYAWLQNTFAANLDL